MAIMTTSIVIVPQKIKHSKTPYYLFVQLRVLKSYKTTSATLASAYCWSVR